MQLNQSFDRFLMNIRINSYMRYHSLTVSGSSEMMRYWLQQIFEYNFPPVAKCNNLTSTLAGIDLGSL